MSCSLEYQTMKNVQKPINSVCYTPSFEPFRIWFFAVTIINIDTVFTTDEVRTQLGRIY
jgi:hypothetical protein